MPRLVYIPQLSQLTDDDFSLPQEEGHHLKVLRCKNLEEILAFDGVGHTRRASLTLLHKGNCLHFKEPVQCIQNTAHCSLLMFLPNEPSTFETILRKACEFGIKSVYTIFGEHTEKKRWEHWNKRSERFRQILIDSCKQAKNPFLPKLFAPQELTIINFNDWDICLYGSLVQKTSTKKLTIRAQDEILCVVGPEGGFSESEESFLNSVAIPVRLSPFVLRSETAVVSLLSFACFSSRAC